MLRLKSLLVCMVAAGLFAPEPVDAGPNSESPYVALGWSKVPETKPLYDEVDKEYQELLQTVNRYASARWA